MRKFFVHENQICNQQINIIGDDVNHIKNVLRLKPSEKIKICDTDHAINYICEIQEIKKQSVTCLILEIAENEAEGNVQIHIFQGMPKADKMELIIQKGTELGASEFIPVAMQRSIVKLSSKDKRKKIDRWQKIAEVAAKQSGRDKIPEVRDVHTMADICHIISTYDLVLVAYELESKNSIKDEIQKLKGTQESYKIAIVIGPEGGIEAKEIEMLRDAGAKIVTLGRRILRTETVALQMVSVIMYELEDVSYIK